MSKLKHSQITVTILVFLVFIWVVLTSGCQSKKIRQVTLEATILPENISLTGETSTVSPTDILVPTGTGTSRVAYVTPTQVTPTMPLTRHIDISPTPTRWIPERAKGKISLSGHAPLLAIYEDIFIADVETLGSVYNLDLKSPFEHSQSQFVGDFFLAIDSEQLQLDIIPINSAKVVQVTQISIDEASFANCEQALYQHNERLNKGIEVGDSFCFLTDEGRISFIRIAGIYGDEFASISISYKTWNPQIGSRYFEVLE